MNIRTGYSTRLASVFLACAVLLALPAAAQDCSSDGYRWTLRGFGAKVSAAGDTYETSSTDPVERSKFHLNSGNAVGAEVEYRVNCPVGIAVGLMSGSLDTMFSYDTEFEWLMGSDDVDFTLLTIGPNFHLSPYGRADFFIGPFLGVMDYSDVDFDGLGGLSFDRNLDGETAIGLNLGVDVPFKDNGPWAVTAGLRYLATSAGGNGFELDVDPLIATAGLAYRWNGKKCGPCEAMMDDSAVAEPAPVVEAPAPAPAPAAPAPVAPAAAPEIAREAPPAEEREVCHFTSSSSRVSNICKAKLDEVALKMKQDPELGAQVLGHADSTGSDRINDPLSMRRAEAVKSYLVERHSIDPTRIETEGRGSREPVASNDTSDGRAENRRAVVIISIG